MNFVRYLSVFTSIVLVLLCSSDAQADPRISRIAAAISIGEKGIADENAALLVAAAEMLDGVRPSGVDLVWQYAEEARFFARGDSGLLQRLDALTFPAPAPDILVQLHKSGDNLPDGVERAAFVPPLPNTVCAAEKRDSIAVCGVGEFADFNFEERTYAVYLRYDR